MTATRKAPSYTARTASSAIRKAGLRVDSCSAAFTERDLDVTIFTTDAQDDADAVAEVLTELGWVSVRVRRNPDYPFVTVTACDPGGRHA